MKKLIIVICFIFCLSVACATSRSSLRQVSLGMTKGDVVKTVGDPEVTRGAIINKFGQVIEVWEYRVMAKGKLLDIMPWDADDYWFYFMEGRLVKWGKAGDWQKEPDRIYEIRFGDDKPLLGK